MQQLRQRDNVAATLAEAVVLFSQIKYVPLLQRLLEVRFILHCLELLISVAYVVKRQVPQVNLIYAIGKRFKLWIQ